MCYFRFNFPYVSFSKYLYVTCSNVLTTSLMFVDAVEKSGDEGQKSGQTCQPWVQVLTYNSCAATTPKNIKKEGRMQCIDGLGMYYKILKK